MPDIIVEETPGGSSRERLREADLDRHLGNGKEADVSAPKPVDPAHGAQEGSGVEGRDKPKG